MVRSPDGDTDFFDIVAGVLQGNAFAPYLFIFWLDYVLRIFVDLLKENGSTLKKAKNRRYPTETLMNTDYVDDLVLFANIQDQAESLLHSQEQATGNTEQI